jgi:Family of unknown function (DUF6308)
MGLCIVGRIVDDPMPIWRAYARRYPRTIREYDLSGHGDPDHLTAEEARRSRIINSRLTRRECEELVARAMRSCPWRDVPQDAELSGADPAMQDEGFDKAARLYWHFTWPERIRGVGVAKVHKVLHIKRPALYPILDDTVRDLYKDSAVPWVSELGRLRVTIEDSPPYWAAIRQDLMENGARLDSYRSELAADGDGTVALMAQLTNLRLQDIVAWQVGSRRRQRAGTDDGA